LFEKRELDIISLRHGHAESPSSNGMFDGNGDHNRASASSRLQSRRESISPPAGFVRCPVCWMGERLVDVEGGVLDMSGAECPAYMLW